jgi:hypothetical protein
MYKYIYMYIYAKQCLFRIPIFNFPIHSKNHGILRILSFNRSVDREGKYLIGYVNQLSILFNFRYVIGVIIFFI